MKKYIRATSARYSVEDFKTVAKEVDTTFCDSDAARAILDADITGLLKTFATSIFLEGDYEFSNNKIIPLDTGSFNYVGAYVKLDLIPLRPGQLINNARGIAIDHPVTYT